MSKEAMKLALEALEEITDEVFSPYDNKLGKAITALREALAEQKDKPYRLLQDNGSKYFGESWDKAEQPAQRTWVGLTNNELQPIADEYRILFGSWVKDFARAIEAKLRGKNS